MGDSKPDDELVTKLQADYSSQVLERLPALWWQKFTVVGATVAFILGKDLWLSNQNLILLAAVSLPLIACLIDLKSAEYAVNSRMIADHVAENDALWPNHAAWYRRAWDGNEAKARTAITVTGTVAPTMGVAVACAVICSQATSTTGWEQVLCGVNVMIAVTTLVIGAVATWRLWEPLPRVHHRPGR